MDNRHARFRMANFVSFGKLFKSNRRAHCTTGVPVQNYARRFPFISK